MRLPVLSLLFCAGLALAQHNQYEVTTPVPILKQINKHNEDGSYSYGYEAADGSYKIESKYATGEVYGKYGFVDDTGSIREVEYGASRRGFEPAGAGINVPPPTLTGNSIANPNVPEDDGQYREDPSVYYTDPRFTNGERYAPVPRQPVQQPIQQQTPRPLPAPIYTPPRYPPRVQYQPQPQPQHQPQFQPQLQPRPQYQPEYQPQYRSQYQPQYQGQQQQSIYPAAPLQSGLQGRPAPNADPNAGLASYTVNYRR
ncbi:cuticular protein 27 [Halictus rubicundus]|uniref:cuticular protein 27 n=1 Tax=Halictus rubicundus TaxID=77578 RepID=UPI004036BC99